MKDILLTLTDCLESNSFALVTIKKLFTERALVDINTDVVNFDSALLFFLFCVKGNIIIWIRL